MQRREEIDRFWPRQVPLGYRLFTVTGSLDPFRVVATRRHVAPLLHEGSDVDIVSAHDMGLDMVTEAQIAWLRSPGERRLPQLGSASIVRPHLIVQAGLMEKTTMRKITGFAAAFLISTLAASPINAAQDHNSSRSNKTASVTADQDTETMIREVSDEAVRMARDMIALEKGRGFDGDFQVKVSVSVQIEKILKK